jgi:membrane associated rhomboid family serine protease
MNLNTTFIIIIATTLCSIIAFSSGSLFSSLLLSPYQIYHRREYYRLLTHGFLHADWMHLIINMFVLFSFGNNVENWLVHLKYSGYIHHPVLVYCLLYFGGVVIASLITLVKHRNNYGYSSVGASGAVSAVVFTSIFFAPLDRLYFFAAIPIPGIVFAVLYLAYSSFMSRRNRDNINHDAHFAGAVYGFIFPILIDFRLLSHFLEALHI